MFRVITIFLLVLLRLGETSIPYPDFKASNLLHGLDNRWDEYERAYSSLDQSLVAFFEGIYRRNIEVAKNDCPCAKDRIPKIVHQIWIGGPVPEKYRKWMESWKSLEFSGWQYMLWTDEEMNAMYMHNRDLFDAATNMGEKSDIVRLEILQQYGGVYVDVDFECVRPEYFDELHRHFDFYAGIEPLLHGVIYKFHLFKFCNAIIGSAPHHPLVGDLITNMKANYLAYGKATLIERTGPSYLTRIICEYELEGAHRQRNMYLPCTLFYPFTICESSAYVSNPEKIMEAFPETAAIHYWGQSWQPDGCTYLKHEPKGDL